MFIINYFIQHNEYVITDLLLKYDTTYWILTAKVYFNERVLSTFKCFTNKQFVNTAECMNRCTIHL